MITWTGIKQSETGEHKKQSQKVFRTQELAAYVAEAPGHLLTQDCQKLPFTEGWNTFLAPTDINSIKMEHLILCQVRRTQNSTLKFQVDGKSEAKVGNSLLALV